MATLRPLKNEVEQVAALLERGAESPEAMATEVIQLVELLRQSREQWITVLELSPGVYTGYGMYPTRAAAQKALTKIPMAQVSRRGAFVPVTGEAAIQAAAERSEAPRQERGDFEIELDRRAFKAGWKGNMRDRHKYVTT